MGDEENIIKTENNQEKCVAVSPISLSNVNVQEMIASPEQDKNSAPPGAGAEQSLRKSGSDTEAGMFTSETGGLVPGVTQDRATLQENCLRIPDHGKGSQSPSKSPGYVRKPMPINEPKPVLPKSKQINVIVIITGCHRFQTRPTSSGYRLPEVKFFW